VVFFLVSFVLQLARAIRAICLFFFRLAIVSGVFGAPAAADFFPQERGGLSLSPFFLLRCFADPVFSPVFDLPLSKGCLSSPQVRAGHSPSESSIRLNPLSTADQSRRIAFTFVLSSLLFFPRSKNPFCFECPASFSFLPRGSGALCFPYGPNRALALSPFFSRCRCVASPFPPRKQDGALPSVIGRPSLLPLSPARSKQPLPFPLPKPILMPQPSLTPLFSPAQLFGKSRHSFPPPLPAQPSGQCGFSLPPFFILWNPVRALFESPCTSYFVPVTGDWPFFGDCKICPLSPLLMAHVRRP